MTDHRPYPANPLTGYFPAAHQTLGRGRFVLHTGGGRDAVPIRSAAGAPCPTTG